MTRPEKTHFLSYNPTSHTIRKTVATQVYRSSDLKGASQQLGHSEVGVTSKHYIEHENRGPADVVGVLDAFIARTQSVA